MKENKIKSAALIKDCINKIKLISDEKTLNKISEYLSLVVISTNRESIPAGTKVFVEFNDPKRPWSDYKGKAIIEEFPIDQSMWIKEAGEEHYKCSVIGYDGDILDNGCYFPVSSIKRVLGD